MLTWKEAARHFWHGRKLAREQEIRLKQRLWNEHEKRVALVAAMSDLLPIIAGNGDPDANQCFVCDHDHGHAADCAYIRALAAVHEAARSVTGD